MLVPSTLAEFVGLKVNFAELVDLGGATGAGMVWRAAAAISNGICSTCLCPTGARREQRPGRMGWGGMQGRSSFAEFEAPYGAVGANFGYAMIANRYRHEYSVTPGQLAKIAVQQRANACANPDAIFYGEPITTEDVLSSPVIVDPLHRLEIVMPCAGAAGSSLLRRSGRRHRLRSRFIFSRPARG